MTDITLTSVNDKCLLAVGHWDLLNG